MEPKGFKFGLHTRLISKFSISPDVEILDGDLAQKLIKAHDEAAKNFITYATNSVARPDVLNKAKHYMLVMNVIGAVINALPSRDSSGESDVLPGDNDIVLPMPISEAD